MPPVPVWNANMAHAGNCRDRPHHQAPGGGNNAHPCSSTHNPTPKPALPPRLLGRAYDYFIRRKCADRLTSGHGAGFTICRYCIDHTKQQPWYTSIFADVTTPPPPIPGRGVPPAAPPPQPIEATPATPAWTCFLTYLCRECEIVEQVLLEYRREQDITDRDVPNGKLMRRPPNGFPENSCTCLGILEGKRGMNYCIRCCYARAPPAHDRLLMVRQQNDEWLRRIGRSATGQFLTSVHGNTRRSREQRGVYRACRCGKEVDSVKGRVPEVLLCMGCEGVVHVAPGVQDGAEPPIFVANMAPTALTRRMERSYRLREAHNA